MAASTVPPANVPTGVVAASPARSATKKAAGSAALEGEGVSDGEGVGDGDSDAVGVVDGVVVPLGVTDGVGEGLAHSPDASGPPGGSASDRHSAYAGAVATRADSCVEVS